VFFDGFTTFPQKKNREALAVHWLIFQHWLLGMTTTGQTPGWKTAFVVDV
jgi:hypothetical protein